MPNIQKLKKGLRTQNREIIKLNEINSVELSQLIEELEDLYESDMYEELLINVDRILLNNPRNSFTWMMKGEALRMIERYKEALSASEIAIELDSENDSAHGTKGSILRAMGRYDEALTAINRALELNPEHEWVAINKEKIISSLEQVI